MGIGHQVIINLMTISAGCDPLMTRGYLKKLLI
jgi:hypothetical protein